MRRRLLRMLILVALLGQAGAWAGGWAEGLQQGREVLLIRHALAPGVGDPPGFSLERCETQRLLDGAGRAQAARIGRWLRAQGLGPAAVYTSPWCRCRETAELLGLGPVAVEPSLASFFNEQEQAQPQTRALQEFIAAALRRADGRALVLVTHHVNIRAYVGRDVGSGDMAVVRVDAAGRPLGFRLVPSP